MLIRYKSVQMLANEIVSKLPYKIFESSITTFADPAVASGSYLLAVKERLEKFGHDKYNIQSRLFAFCSSKMQQNIIKKRFGFEPTFIQENFLEASMEFNVVIGNPPYEGRSALHQQFFNKAVEITVDGGVVCFIQPATPYFNKKTNKKSHEISMIENLKKYDTSVKFYPPDAFGNVLIGTGLSATFLTKTLSSMKIISTVEYDNGSVYKNLNIEDINFLAIEPVMYNSIKAKYLHFINKNGSLHDITDYSGKKQGAYIQGIRGHIGTDDFFTIISDNEIQHVSSDKKVKGMSADIEKDRMKYFFSYAKTFVARYGLAMTKFNQHNDTGELKTVPLVTFDRHWSDEDLAKIIGLTEEELAVIRSVLPDFHGLLKNVG